MLLLLFATPVAGQDDANTDGATEEEKDAMDEIVVRAGKPGDPDDVEVDYEELLRSKLLDDLQRLQDEEENVAWRDSATRTIEGPGRMSWGYKPGDELELRRETDLMDVQYETVKPASIFRFEF